MFWQLPGAMCFCCPGSSSRAPSCQSPLPLESRARLSRNCSPSGTGSDGRRQESQPGGESRLWLALKATDETSGREAFSQNLPLPGCSSADGQGTHQGCQGAAKAEAGLWFSTCSVKEVNQRLCHLGHCKGEWVSVGGEPEMLTASE